MICPTCKRFKTSSNYFCPDDGAKLIDFRCQCGNPLSITQKFCEHCGAKCPELALPVAEVA